QAPAYEVEVLDPIPDHLGQIIASTGGVIQADAVYWRFAEIMPGQVVSMTWNAIVDEQLPADAEIIVNEATVQDATGQVEADQAGTNLLAQRLGLVKTGSAIIEPGGDVIYTITVRNLGGADLYDITVTDRVPEYILAPRDISAGGKLKGNTEVGWEIAPLAAGQEAVLTWVGTLDPGVPADESEVWNDVSATTGSGLETGARARSKILRPVLMMTKLAPFAAGPGETITYTIIIENAGQVPAHEVVVHDPIPAGMRHPSIASGGFIDYLPTYEAQWRLGDMQPGTRRTLIWTGEIDPRIELEPGVTHSINNTATVRDSSGTGVEAAARTIILQPQVDLTKLATSAAGPGEPVDYTIIVSNTGETTLYGLRVTDPVPQTIVNPTHISHSGVLSDGQVIWSLGNGLPAGETLSLTWSGTVDLNVPQSVGHIRNRADLTAYPDLSGSAESVTQILRPAVEIFKAAPDEIEAGDMITYTLTVTNTGPVTLFETTITDSYPHVISPTTMSDKGTMSGSDIVWSLDNLAAGEVVQLNWSGLVDPALPVTVPEIKNTVVVTALAGVAAETAVTTTVRQPVLQIVKTVIGAARPGGRLQYRLEISNTGQAVAHGVRIEDILPGYVIPQAIDNGGYEVPSGYTVPGGYGINGRIIWTLGDLSAGDMEIVSWQGVVGYRIRFGRPERRGPRRERSTTPQSQFEQARRIRAGLCRRADRLCLAVDQ
ncbi:Ig-like domain-containing protein, partial [Chloroflexota bacterium]